MEIESKDLSAKDLKDAKPVYKLESWYIEDASEHRKPMAFGNVYGHPRFRDGHYIHTSIIISQHLGDIQPKIVTLNSIYLLGKPMRDLSK